MQDNQRSENRLTAETGLIAAVQTSRSATRHCLVEAGIAATDHRLSGTGQRLRGDALAGRLAGLSAAGMRATGFSNGEGLIDVLPSLAGKPLPCVIHILPLALARHGKPLHGSDELAEQLAAAGGFQLCAATVQEAADFALIAQRAAELALRPGLIFLDPDNVGAALQMVRLPEPEQVRDYLGAPEDLIETPTPAQRLIFGPRRRRVPVLLDCASPGGLGGAQDGQAFGLGSAARAPYLDEHLPELLRQAMAEFEELTGRRYQPLSTHQTENADALVICAGAECEHLCALADRQRLRGRSVGVVAISQRMPLPAEDLAATLLGKHTITVVERCAANGGADAPLAGRVRAALDRITENGFTDADHSGYPSLRNPRLRPRLLAGAYGIGAALPSTADWLAVFDNLFAEDPVDRFQVGVPFLADARRFPRIQVLEQQLLTDYPELRERSLPAGRDDAADAPDDAAAIRLIGASSRSTFAIGTAVGRALGALEPVRSQPRSGAQGAFAAAELDLWLATEPQREWTQSVGLVLVSDESLLPQAMAAPVARGARVVVASRLDEEAVRNGIEARVWTWLARNDLTLELVSLTAGERRATSQAPAWTDQQSAWMLLGAATAGRGDAIRAEDMVDTLHEQLTSTGISGAACDEIINWFENGRQQRRQRLEPVEHGAPDDSEPPWTARHGETTPLFDPARFWHTNAYLFDRNEIAHAIPEPAAATGFMPAGSSARRDLGQHRFRTPEWLPENCTGCGRCWALCPDSALPATAHQARALIEAGVTLLKADGKAVTQLSRVSSHLAVQIDQLIKRRGPEFPRTAGGLLRRAFAALAERMGLADSIRSAMENEVHALATLYDEWPFAVTSRWYGTDGSGPGPGRLLTIPLNPSACKGCGICLAACPDGAFDWREYSGEAEKRDRGIWKLRMALPDDSAAQEAIAPELAPYEDLLSKRAYHGLVGGDAAQPGSGVKTALHLIISAIDAVSQRSARTDGATVEALVEGVRRAIQESVDGSVAINDFEAFRQRLQQSHGAALNHPALVAAADDGDAHDASRVTGLLDHLAKLECLHQRLREQRSGLYLVFSEGQPQLHAALYPDNPHAHPWIAVGPDPLALAQGVLDGLSDRVHADQAIIDRARLALAGRPDGKPPAWAELASEDRLHLPPVIVVADPELLDWSEVADTLASDRALRIVLIDAAGPVPGRRRQPDDLIGILRRHCPDQTAMETLADPARLIAAAQESLEVPGPSVMQIYAPEPDRCGFPTDQAFAICELAERCGVIAPWTFSDASAAPERTDSKLTAADWALAQGQFRSHFQLLGRGQLRDDAIALTDFLDLPLDQRRPGAAYLVAAAGKAGKTEVLALPSPAMIAFAQARRETPPPAPQATPVSATPPAAGDDAAENAAPAAEARQRLIDNLLTMSGFDTAGTSLGELLAARREEKR